MEDLKKVSRALISVSDKTGVVEFAKNLMGLGIKILSTGGTYKLLRKNGIEAEEISAYTEFPEMMDGRVKTLHPKVHGGILGRRGVDDAVMSEHGIDRIDLVVVNLYAFANAVAQPGCDIPTAIENIDIGGPAMLRSAAKNHQDVAVLTNTEDYSPVLKELTDNGGQLSYRVRYELMVKAFEHTAAYDGMIANHFGARDEQNREFPSPNTFNIQFLKSQDLRYGENPHQSATFYLERNPSEPSISTAKQLQGKALSYNNIADTDAALECVKQFDLPCCVIVKHANPCGVAVAENLEAAYRLAFQTDPESAFGGIIAFNRELDSDTITAIFEGQFVEVIIAPSVSKSALDIANSKTNVRILECGSWDAKTSKTLNYKRITGGLLVQDRDIVTVNKEDLKVVTKRQPSEDELTDMLFAWKVAKMVKSNAIIYAKDQRTIGVGAGQMSRINSARIASIKADHAGLSVTGAVMASDAFFPFRDGIDNAAEAGIRGIIQPGGSMRDAEVIAAANDREISMVFTSIRHFLH